MYPSFGWFHTVYSIDTDCRGDGMPAPELQLGRTVSGTSASASAFWSLVDNLSLSRGWGMPVAACMAFSAYTTQRACCFY